MKMRARILIGMLVASVLFWFVGFTRVVTVEKCLDCGRFRFVDEYRLCGTRLFQRSSESHTLKERIALDLGVPCDHQNTGSYIREKRWGGIIAIQRPQYGTITIGETDNYDAEMSKRVEALAKTSQTLPADFRRRVLRQHDQEFYDEVLDQIYPRNTSGKEKDEENGTGPIKAG